MPSYPIKANASTTPLAVNDFNIGIAEQWLEQCQKVTPWYLPEIQDLLRDALDSCKEIRDTLREITPQIGRDPQE